ncbi:hypothetical protein D3C77_89680 [compost metagenome]
MFLRQSTAEKCGYTPEVTRSWVSATSKVQPAPDDVNTIVADSSPPSRYDQDSELLAELQNLRQSRRVSGCDSFNSLGRGAETAFWDIATVLRFI